MPLTQWVDENVGGCARETKAQGVKGSSHQQEDLSVGHQNLVKPVVEQRLQTGCCCSERREKQEHLLKLKDHLSSHEQETLAQTK